jgi:hypothetical protein
MQAKLVLCICSKSFKTNNAMLQHQRDSPRHVNETRPVLLSLQGREVNHGVRCADQSKVTRSANCTKFIPSSGGGATSLFTRNPDIRIPSWSETIAPSAAPKQVTLGEKKVFVAEGAKKKSKKKKTKMTESRELQRIDRGDDFGWQVNVNTGRMMDLSEDQNWGLCDKDCGWCGHCTEGVDLY